MKKLLWLPLLLATFNLFAGTVSGPLVTTSNAVPVWDSSTGKLLANSTLIYSNGVLYVNGVAINTNSATGAFILDTNNLIQANQSAIDNGTAGTNAFVIIGGSGSSITNGTQLTNAYARAKLKTPNGAALTRFNRYTIFLLPGVYTVADGVFIMDTEYIDLVGLSTYAGNSVYDAASFTGVAWGDCVISSTGNALNLTAGNVGDVTIANVTLATSTAGKFAFNPVSSRYQNKLSNVLIVNTSAITDSAMAVNITYSGVYTDVRCFNARAFGYGLASVGIASGTFIRCKAASASFGAALTDAVEGRATGTFIDCEADGLSFGRTLSSGTFLRCRYVNVDGATGGMFGYSQVASTASGTYDDCIAVNSGTCWGTTFSGVVRHCTVSGTSFSPGTFSGQVVGCYFNGIWTNSVTINAGTASFGALSAQSATVNGSPVLTNATAPTTNTVIVLALGGTGGTNVSGGNWASGNAAGTTFKLILTTNAFFGDTTFTNVPVTNGSQYGLLHIIQDATGVRTVTWTNSIFEFVNGISIAQTTNANSEDVYSLFNSVKTNGNIAVIPMNNLHR